MIKSRVKEKQAFRTMVQFHVEGGVGCLLRRVTLCTMFLVLLICGGLSATSLNGRFGISCYGFEQEERHFDLYEKTDLALVGIGHPGISAHANFRLKKDLLDGASLNTKLWSAFLDWKTGTHHVRIGRQSISSCMRRVSLDGVLLRTGYRRLVAFTVFGGMEATDSLKVESWRNARFMGARIAVLPAAPAQFNIGWIRSDENDDRSLEFLGADTRFVLGPLSIYSELDYDAVDHSVSDVVVHTIYRIQHGIVTADFRRTRPRFPKDSFFRNFAVEPTQCARLGIQWLFRGNIQAFSQYSVFYVEGDPAQGIESSIGTRHLTVGYLYSTGYGGELNGATCTFRKRLFPSLELFGTGRLGWYSRASREDEERMESAVRIGGTYQIREFWSCGLCGEHMTGRRYSSDSRILLKTTLILREGL